MVELSGWNRSALSKYWRDWAMLPCSNSNFPAMKSAVALNSALPLLSRLARTSALTLPSLMMRATRSPSFARLSAGVKADGRKHDRRGRRQWHTPTHRIDNATEEREDEVSGVRALQIAEIDAAEAPRQRQGVIAFLLQAARIEMRHIVILRVVVGHIVDEGKAQSGESGLLEEREVGIVGKQLVGFVAERGSHRVRRGGGEFAYDPAVALAGFEHHGRADLFG